MKIKHLTLVIFTLALGSTAHAEASIEPARDCPRVVQFELGERRFESGDSISIQEVRGSTELIQTGGTYCVTGTYTLASQDEADLALFATTTNLSSSPVSAEQTVRVRKGTGPFSLVKRMTGDGYLHVSFYSLKTGQGFGGVYFGQGGGVLRDKRFSYHDSTTASTSGDVEPIAPVGPNKVLFNFLGNPVTPPANMDPAYTTNGLAQAMETAARNAGIALLRLEIDDSEFPFLLGVTFAGPGDKPKLVEQIRKMPSYKTSGGVGGEKTYAMNIVPYEAFPLNTLQRIYRRMTLREAVLHERLLSTP